MKERKTDRRTLYTRSIIKNALLELEREMPFNQIRVSRLCEQAEISRATFYLHFESLKEVLDSILDDALLFSESENGTIIDVLGVIRQGDVEALKKKDAVLPACQRIADSEKYHTLFMDESLGDYIIRKMAQHEKAKVVPSLMRTAGISKEDAEVLFRFILHGTFSVNQSLEWKKNARWYRLQQMLGKFIQAGIEGI